MKDTLTRENAHDFSQRYAQTYGWLINENKRDFVYITEVGGNACYFTKGSDVLYHAVIDSNVFFEFIPVDKGWFNTNDGKLIFLQRHPARQFKRGIAEGNTNAFTPDNRVTKLSYKLLSTIFVDGFDNWAHTDLSKIGAISKHFAVTDKEGTIMMYNAPIGKFINGVIVLNDDLFKQELQDTLRRKNIDVKVINA